MDYRIIEHGPSRSFPDGDPFRAAAVDSADVEVHLGTTDDVPLTADRTCVLIELDLECLGTHTGESDGAEGDRRIGFARWRVGDDDPSDLVELVVQPGTHPAAVDAARSVFEDQGLTAVVCSDAPGRILNALLRPYFNDALRAIDRRIASAEDLDKTVRLGLGYPEGPVGLLLRSGLQEHHRVSAELHRQIGEAGFVPARRAAVAAARD